MSDKKTVLENVRDLMEKYPECRDDDKKLIWTYWRVIDELISNPGHQLINSYNFMLTTSTARIIRCRAIIQNDEEKLLPTTWEIARKRKIKEEVWREYVGLTPTGQSSLGLGI